MQGLSIADAERLSEEYEREMVRLQRSPYTITVYRWGWRSLIKFARPYGIVNRDTIERWQECQATRWSASSLALAGVSVRRMLLWAANNGACDAALARAVPPGKYDHLRLPRPLAPDDLKKVEQTLRWEDGASPSIYDLRDKALFYYVKATAARVGEVLQVKRATYKWQLIRQTQAISGERVLAPPPGVVKLIEDYLAARTDDSPWLWVALWPSGKVTKLQDAGVLKIWERLAKRAGVPRFTTYQVRQTAGTILAEQGHDLVDIMVHFGARHVDAVQGYRQLYAQRNIDKIRADLDVPPDS